jgi:two-component system OmpR family response regulator
MNQKKRVLVVEDEMHLAAGIKFNLEAEGYMVMLAEDGAAALELVDQQGADVDLIVLDLMLPGMSGYSVCERLREQGHRMPILMLSARTLAEDKARGFDVGANQYLVKPFELDELLSRVKNLLLLGPVAFVPRSKADEDGKVRPLHSRVEFADCTIDFTTFQLTRSGKTTRLTALQMKVLKYMIQNAGHVVARSELLEKVWEMPGNIQTRAPDQVIRQLRKLLEPDPANPVHLLTLRDTGYMFVEHPEQEVRDGS